jgi:beta-lactamase class D
LNGAQAMPTRLRIASALAALLPLLAVNGAIAKPRPKPPCFLLQELGGRELSRINPERCRRALAPASTFKIPHAVIALETGALKDENEVVQKPAAQSIPSWDREQTLVSALHHSVVWFFQRTSRSIGVARMSEWLNRLDYGNREVAGEADLFWLNGGLRITAEQQMDFLQKFFSGKLPASPRALGIVKSALRQRPGFIYGGFGEKRLEFPWPADAVLYAKSGYARPAQEHGGWYVGMVERAGRSYVFVTAIEQAGNSTDTAAEAFKQLRAAGVL